MKNLKERKRLLIAEAELQRCEMGNDIETIRHSIQHYGVRAKSAGAILTAVGIAVSAVTALRHRGHQTHNGKTSLLGSVLAGARVASSLWQAFRSRSSSS